MAIGTTKIQAVNTMLSNIGEAPVNSLSDPRPTDVAIAEGVLDEVSRAVQAEGWDFNTDYELVLLPDAITNEILLPADSLSLKARRRWIDKFSVRGNRLFNHDDRNFVWTDSVEVDLVRELPFEDMPEPAKQYVMQRSARVFRERVNDDPRDRVPSEQEIKELGKLQNHEAIATNSKMSDSVMVGRITGRLSPMDGYSE